MFKLLSTSLADLQYLDPVGLLVFDEETRRGGHCFGQDADGALWFSDSDFALITGEYSKPLVQWEARDELYVSFEKRDVRNRAADFLGNWAGLPYTATSPEFGLNSAEFSHWHISARHEFAVFGPQESFGSRCVPGLAHIDTTDTERLVDGSLRMNALALRTIVLHLMR